MLTNPTLPAGPPAKKRKIANSIFPKVVNTQPTPEATPKIGSIGSPELSLGGFNVPVADHVNREVAATRAWSVATRFISDHGKKHQGGKLSSAEASAFELLLGDRNRRNELASYLVNELRESCWGTVRNDFLQSCQYGNADLLEEDDGEVDSSTNPEEYNTKLSESLLDPKIERVRTALIRKDSSHEILLTPFLAEVDRNMTHIMLDLCPARLNEQYFCKRMFSELKQSLDSTSNNPQACIRNKTCNCRISPPSSQLRPRSYSLGGLQRVFEKALALATREFLSYAATERRCFAVDWEDHGSVIPRLRSWVRDHVCPPVSQFLVELRGARPELEEDRPGLEDDVVENLELFAVESFCFGRARNLFDYVKTWPHSKGAILDIKELIADQKSDHKATICSIFMTAMEQRLLHAGASTTELFSFYINTIHVFKALDPRGVLLTKVAQPIRAHLRGRDDTVAIIAASFLADIDKTGAVEQDEESKVCADFAREVNGAPLEDMDEDRVHDWDDMNWQPDPIDAGPDFRSSKKEDVITCILNLFPVDEFIKEVTSVLARHLLESTSPEFAKETRLVELFKSRFDPTKLEPAEVMLRDVQRSTNVSKKLVRQGESSIVDVQILSSYFWPQMRNSMFSFPEGFDKIFERFIADYMQQGFGSTQRKIHWRPALTKVSMKLELEDRVVEEEDVSAWRASIIDAFAAADITGLNAEDLAQRLQMDEELVADGIYFWLNKRVLYQPSPDTYAVLERLDMDEAPTAATAAQAPEIAAVMSHDAVLHEKAPMFEIFIGNMLKNGPPKEVGGMMGIANMLRMVLPDFTYGEKEVLFLLGNLEAKGEVVRSGDTWSAAK